MKGREIRELSFKIKKATSKGVAITEMKEKQYVKQIIYVKQGHLSAKVIDLTDEPVIQCDVPGIENTFLYRCK